nr:MAG TPA: hypothetical protein [Caudoviricetes sp.]
MNYLEIFQTVGGFIFALCFWYMCYKVEQTINNIKG